MSAKAVCICASPDQSVNACRVLEACPAADRPPLWGIPFAVKDNIDVVGFHTTAACKAFAYMPDKSAAAVQALLDAGVQTLTSCTVSHQVIPCLLRTLIPAL